MSVSLSKMLAASITGKQERGRERAVSLKGGSGRGLFIRHSIWQNHEIINAQPSV